MRSNGNTSSPLRALDAEQKAEVLKRLLRARPRLRPVVDRIAAQVFGEVDYEKIARAVAIAVVTVDAEPGGSDEFGGYHEPGENVEDDLEEAIEPYVADMKKRLKLGRVLEAQRVCMGIVLGLYRASQESAANMGGLDDYPEWPSETAEEVIDTYRGRRSRSKRPESPPFPVWFWKKMHSGWSDTLDW